MSNNNSTQNNELINTIYKYLDGGETAEIREILNKLYNDSSINRLDLDQPILVNNEIENTLFKMLCVPEDKQNHYRHKNNLFQLLDHLNQDNFGHGHLGFLISLIDHAKYNSYRQKKNPLSFLVRLVALMVFFILRKPVFINTGYTSFSFLRFLYRTFRHGLSNLKQKLLDLFFRGLATGLSLAGYILCFLAAGVTTPLITILFISSEAIDLVQNLTNYFMIRLKPINKQEAGLVTWDYIADQERQKNQQEQAEKSVWINLGAALLVTGIFVILLFFPQGLIPPLVCMMTFGIIAAVKSALLSSIESECLENLQKALQNAKKSFGASGENSPAPDQTVTLWREEKSNLSDAPTEARTNQPDYLGYGTNCSFFNRTNNQQLTARDRQANEDCVKTAGLVCS